jgi:hypothetical protein
MLKQNSGGKKSPRRIARTVPEWSIVSLDSINVEFGRRGSVSPYRVLLEQLLDAPRNSALKINNLKSRYSIIKQARALGYKVVFAEHEEGLYVKIDGMLQEDQPAGTKVTNGATEKTILRGLSTEPKTSAELARDLNIDPAACETVLTRLVKERVVERDTGLGKSAVYRAVVKAKGAG